MPDRRREFTVAQAALMCGVTPATVRSWLHRGHLVRTSRGTVDGAALLAYLDGRGDRGQRTSRQS